MKISGFLPPALPFSISAFPVLPSRSSRSSCKNPVSSVSSVVPPPLLHQFPSVKISGSLSFHFPPSCSFVPLRGPNLPFHASSLFPFPSVSALQFVRPNVSPPTMPTAAPASILPTAAIGTTPTTLPANSPAAPDSARYLTTPKGRSYSMRINMIVWGSRGLLAQAARDGRCERSECRNESAPATAQQLA